MLLAPPLLRRAGYIRMLGIRSYNQEDGAVIGRHRLYFEPELQ